MLFNELDRVRRHIIMMAIIFIFAGIALIEVSEEYLSFVGVVLAIAMLVWSFVKILEFGESPKTLIAYLVLFVALAVALVALGLLLFDWFFLMLLTLFTGALPILVGVFGMYYVLVFARRSGRRGWRIPLVLSALLVAFGVLVIVNPWSYDLGAEQKVIGGALTYSAFIYALMLAWILPNPVQEER